MYVKKLCRGMLQMSALALVQLGSGLAVSKVQLLAHIYPPLQNAASLS